MPSLEEGTLVVHLRATERLAMSAPMRRAAAWDSRSPFVAPPPPRRRTRSTAYAAPVASFARARHHPLAVDGRLRGFAAEAASDFKPKVHATGGDEVQAAIAQDVKENRVLLYMKGTPSAPRCGFSNMAVQILNFHNGLCEPRRAGQRGAQERHQGVHVVTPIPQVFIDEFVGGCDILRQMHSDGELEKLPEESGRWTDWFRGAQRVAGCSPLAR